MCLHVAFFWIICNFISKLWFWLLRAYILLTLFKGNESTCSWTETMSVLLFFFFLIIIHFHSNVKEEEGERRVESFLAPLFSAAQAVLVYVRGGFRWGSWKYCELHACFNYFHLSWGGISVPKRLTSRDAPVISKFSVHKSDLWNIFYRQNIWRAPPLSPHSTPLKGLKPSLKIPASFVLV